MGNSVNEFTTIHFKADNSSRFDGRVRGVSSLAWRKNRNSAKFDCFRGSLSFYLKVEKIVEPGPTFLAFPLHRGVLRSLRGLKIV